MQTVEPELRETTAVPARLALSRRERRRFWREGFLVAPSPVLSAAGIEELASLLDALLERFDDLPAAATHDLGPAGADDPESAIPEVIRASELEPGLRDTEASVVGHELARSVLGRRAVRTFDHAIVKPAGCGSEVPWHQDRAYSGARSHVRSVHIWFSVDDARVDNGCLWYVPGSHAALVAHRPRGGDATAHAREAVDADTSGAVAAAVAAGGLTAHTPLTLHRSGPNTSAHDRRAWIVQFAERPVPRWRRALRAARRGARPTASARRDVSVPTRG